MGVLSKLLQLISFIGVILLITMVAAAAAQAKPGCDNMCGGVEIPYPFGLSEGCYLDDDNRSFSITCDGSDPKPKTGNVTVANISIETHEMHVLMLVARNCYSKSGALRLNIPSWLYAAQFTISKTKNQFTVVGCDSIGLISGIQNGSERFLTGCVSKCNSLQNVVNDSCSGFGCCKVDFPDGLQYIEVEVGSSDNHTGIWY